MTGTTISDGPAPSSADRLSITLPPHLASCARARHAVRAFCQANALPQLADDAELLCSELVTNAIQHSGGQITLVAESAGGGLRVTVDDAGPAVVPVAGRRRAGGVRARDRPGQPDRGRLGHLAARQRKVGLVPAALTVN